MIRHYVFVSHLLGSTTKQNRHCPLLLWSLTSRNSPTSKSRVPLDKRELAWVKKPNKNNSRETTVRCRDDVAAMSRHWLLNGSTLPVQCRDNVTTLVTQCRDIRHSACPMSRHRLRPVEGLPFPSLLVLTLCLGMRPYIEPYLHDVQEFGPSEAQYIT